MPLGFRSLYCIIFLFVTNWSLMFLYIFCIHLLWLMVNKNSPFGWGYLRICLGGFYFLVVLVFFFFCSFAHRMYEIRVANAG